MELLVVSTWLPYPPDNGSRIRAYELLRHLARRHSVTLLSFGAPTLPDDLVALRSFCKHVEVVPPTPLRGGRLGMRGLLSPVPRYFVQTESARMGSLVAAHVLRHHAAMALQVTAALYLGDGRQSPASSRKSKSESTATPRPRRRRRQAAGAAA